MIRKLSRYAPLGMNMSPQKNTLIWGGLAALCWSFYYFVKLHNAWKSLYRVRYGVYELREGAVMQDFVEILGPAFLGFAVLALAMLAFAVYHYAYHSQGSKSIYLMRRLPNRWELHRRCLTIPLVSVILCGLLVFILLCIYYWAYILVTPEVCLTPGQWQKIWRLRI